MPRVLNPVRPPVQPPDPRERERQQHRKYSHTEKGRRTRERIQQTRQTRERALIVDYTMADWRTTLAEFDHRCAYCERFTILHRDHFLPVILGGNTTRDNMVPACVKCNTAKKDKHPLEFLLTLENGLATYTRIFQHLLEKK